MYDTKDVQSQEEYDMEQAYMLHCQARDEDVLTVFHTAHVDGQVVLVEV